MAKNAFRPGGVIAVVCAAAVVVIAGIVYTKDTAPNAQRSGTDSSSASSSLNEDELARIEAQGDALMREQLLQAFDAGDLFLASSYDVPGTENKLVLAMPKKSESEGFMNCGLDGELSCGLYIQTPTSSNLLLFGSQLAGFDGVPEFIDTGHAVVAFSWSLFHYTSIDRKQLNLDNAELLPLLSLELDMMDDGAELQASGNGNYGKLIVSGLSENGRVIPNRIRIEDEQGKTTFELDGDVITSFANAVRTVPEKSPPIFIEPQNDDIRTYAIHLLLFGEPYLFDVQKSALTPVPLKSE